MPSATQRRITVINDNPEFLELMSAILDEDAGYSVTTLTGDSTTIAEIAESSPDLMVVDLLLGGASGWEIVALARADERLMNLPIIICSADVIALREREAELADIGNVHVLPKPFGIADMTELVERLIGAPVSG